MEHKIFWVQILKSGEWINIKDINLPQIEVYLEFHNIASRSGLADANHWLDKIATENDGTYDFISTSKEQEASSVWLKEFPKFYASGITLRELLLFNWNDTFWKNGYIGQEEYKRFHPDKEPKNWREGACGPNIKKISNDEMDKMIASKELKNSGLQYYTNVSWKRSYKDAMPSFYSWSLEKLKKYANGKLATVRICYAH